MVLLISGCSCGTPSGSDSGTGGGGFGGGTTGGGTTGGGGGSTGGGGGATGGGTGGGAQDAGTDAGVDAGSMDAGTDAGTLDAGTLCQFTPAPIDGTRHVVVSHPFPDDGGTRDNQWELFSLSSTGTLTPTGTFWRMGRTSDPSAPVVFTPDGRIGFAAQEDGTIGIFKVESNTVTVINPRLAGAFSAGKLVLDPAGNRLWVLDFNTQNNGGGLYRLDIDCSGNLFNEQYVFPGNNAAAATYLPTAKTLVVATRSLGTSAMMQDLVQVDLSGPTPALGSSNTGFPDRDAIAPTVSATLDEHVVAMPDNGFSVGSRIAFFGLSAGTLTARQVVNTTNPISVTFSPFADVGMVVNTDGADQFRRVTWNAGATLFVVSAPLTYAFGRPQLPSAPVMITRGMLTGNMLVAELDAIRQLRFETDGGITDVAKVSAGGTGSGQILGTIGVSP
ncbi:MAG: hypothetical protein U0228_21275 [Myxococcaceae bacterium]